LPSSERDGRKRRRQIVKGEGVRRRRGAAILSVSTPTVCSVRGRPRQLARSSADMLVGKVQIGAIHNKTCAQKVRAQRRAVQRSL
jgi:hypothetical protein